MLLLFCAISVYMPYAREQRIARGIRTAGGEATFESLAPAWVPKNISDRMPLWDRISSVVADDSQITDVNLEKLQGATSLTGV